jgi:xanthine dehydrogenase accessory factor
MRCLCIPFAQVAEQLAFSPEVFLVIMTHGHRYDELVLRQCLHKEYRYLGMLGSEKKAAEVLEHLLQDGIDRHLASRVFSPIGFAIGSNTPEEIAVSIVAELVAVRRGVAGRDAGRPMAHGRALQE